MTSIVIVECVIRLNLLYNFTSKHILKKQITIIICLQHNPLCFVRRLEIVQVFLKRFHVEVFFDISMMLHYICYCTNVRFCPPSTYQKRIYALSKTYKNFL